MIKIKENPYSPGNLLKRGVMNGLLAGVFLVIGQMSISLWLGQPFDRPLRMTASLVLGFSVLVPRYTFSAWPAVALAVHAALSCAWGAIFVFLLAGSRRLEASLAACVGYGTFYGVMLWAVNFIVVGPVVFPQIALVDPFWEGFVAHIFFFGSVLGYLFGASRPRPSRAGRITGMAAKQKA